MSDVKFSVPATFLKKVFRSEYWSPDHMISHLNDWIFVTGGNNAFISVRLSVKIEEGVGGAKESERDRYEGKNTPFVVFNHTSRSLHAPPMISHPHNWIFVTGKN